MERLYLTVFLMRINGLRQFLETMCPKLAFIENIVVLFFFGDHNI